MDPALPTVVHLSWPSPGDGLHYVETNDGTATPPATPVDGTVSVTVLGLKAGAEVELRAVSELSDGRRLESEVQALSLAPRDPELPSLALAVPDTGLAEPGGFVALALVQAERSWIAIVDREGDYVWWHDAGSDVVAPTVEVARSGTELLYSAYDALQEVDIGVIRRVGLRDGAVTTTRAILGHHDFAELPDGRLAWLAFSTEQRRIDEELVLVTGDAIVLGEEGGGEDAPTETLVDLLDTWREPAITCEHTEAVIAGTGGLDWTHGNSLVYAEERDAFYLMARNQDALLEIDAASGEIRWELSPESDDWTGPAEDLWDHPHLSQVLPDGLVFFDNRDHDPSPVSALARYAFDEEAGTFARTWEYPDPEGRAIQALGDARLLPGGNVISSWMSAGTVVEVTPDQQVAWQLETTLGAGIARIRYLPDLYDVADAP